MKSQVLQTYCNTRTNIKLNQIIQFQHESKKFKPEFQNHFNVQNDANVKKIKVKTCKHAMH